MKCKYCEAELEEGSTICPGCGKDNAEPAVEETAAAAQEPVTEETAVSAEEAAAPSEETSAPVEEIQTTQIKEGVTKLSPGKLALGIVAVVVLVAALAALVMQGVGVSLNPSGETEGTETQAPTQTVGDTVSQETAATTIPASGNSEDVTCKGSYTVSDEDAIAAMDTVVATMGDSQLTNGELQIYYWLNVQQFLNSYGSYASYIGLDYTQPLDTQVCTLSEDGITWQQYFLEGAISSWHNYKALANESLAKGFALDEDYRAMLDGLPESLATDGGLMGFATAEEYLAYNVGVGSSVEDYVAYMEDYYQGYLYFSEQYSTFTPTQEEMEAYFTEHEAEYAEGGLTREDKYVNIRHILVFPEGADSSTIYTDTFSDEAWAVGEANANAILEQWLAGEATEDTFAELANEHSQDPGSNTAGGLYTEVAQGDMVEAFDSWCFDEARQVGDYGIVKTELGYHIMYFSGSTPAWHSQVQSDIISQRSNDMVASIAEAHPMEVDYSAIVLGFVDLTA